MKILQLSESIYPLRMGGVEKHVYDLSNELTKLGNEVTILVKSLPEDKKLQNFGNTLSINTVNSQIELYNFILKNSFDIIHYHNLGPQPAGYFQNEIIQILTKIRRKKIVNTPHGTLDVLSKSLSSLHHSKHAMKLYLNFLTHISLKLVDRLIAVNPYQVKLMESLGIQKNKIKLIPNGIPSYSFDCGDGESFVNRYGLQNKKILLYLGRLNPRKRVSDILDILPKVVKAHRDTVLVVMGFDEGSLKELMYLAKKLNIEEHLIFTGSVTEKEKIDALNAAYMFINPSGYEAFGITVLEAMAQETPVISANNEGAKYLLENGKYGLLYKIGNKDELAKCILSLLDDEKKAKEFAEKGRKRAEKFRWENIAKEMINVYDELVKR